MVEVTGAMVNKADGLLVYICLPSSFIDESLIPTLCKEGARLRVAVRHGT